MFVILSVYYYGVLHIQMPACLSAAVHTHSEKIRFPGEILPVCVWVCVCAVVFILLFVSFLTCFVVVLCSTEICKLQALRSKLNILNKLYQEHKLKLNYPALYPKPNNRKQPPDSYLNLNLNQF